MTTPENPAAARPVLAVAANAASFAPTYRTNKAARDERAALLLVVTRPEPRDDERHDNDGEDDPDDQTEGEADETSEQVPQATRHRL
jgi:hypothetical protein